MYDFIRCHAKLARKCNGINQSTSMEAELKENGKKKKKKKKRKLQIKEDLLGKDEDLEDEKEQANEFSSNETQEKISYFYENKMIESIAMSAEDVPIKEISEMDMFLAKLCERYKNNNVKLRHYGFF